MNLNKITLLDEGVYTCRVTRQRSLDDIKSANTNVIVVSKPTFDVRQQRKKVLKFKESGSLNCVAHSKVTTNVSELL